MIEQGFNYTGCTIKEMKYFFESRVESLEPKEGNLKAKKNQEQTSKEKKQGKRKYEESDSDIASEPEGSSSDVR